MDDRPAMRRPCRLQARCTVTNSHRKMHGLLPLLVGVELDAYTGCRAR
ncbi:hypothetical protein SETIT_6G077500v2 [Setaria italica]|uniref:Uncharacterized protein n=1 Tax=Setaria italica TaxID=4555 RepID=A0A368RKU6_SETIT|nr:hypothetical protein SETIT_6G077500v2 [Setaria italica]